jgi:hypothetical protein
MEPMFYYALKTIGAGGQDPRCPQRPIDQVETGERRLRRQG